MKKNIPLFYITIFFLVGFLTFSSFGLEWNPKKDYPQDYFRSPVNNAILLSGTFGELRPNHLHSGIDIKAHKGKRGQPILAAAEGYVARIKIQSGGYGNVLYVNHPNGYTTVYAHLGSFPKEIDAYVKKAQYRKNKFEIELFPKADVFTFTKGQKIGTLGMSGRSYGPHLHFEIRDTKTEKPINPLLFGLKSTDKVAPKLHELKIYYLNDKRESLETKTYDLIKGKRDYRIDGDTLYIPAWRAGFGLKVYDHMTGTPNWNGIYSLEMLQDDEPAYSFEMETFAFRESRYINAHLDYGEQVSNKSYFNRCYSLPGNKLSVYDNVKEKGVITLHKDKASKITMIAKDIAGNNRKLEFWVKRAEVKSFEKAPYNYLLPYKEENIIDNDALYAYFPKGTFYENLYLQYRSSNEKSSNIYSAVQHVHDYETPVHKYYDLAIRPTNLPDDLRDKAFIAYCQPDTKVISCGGEWKDGRLQTKVRDLGDFYIMVDDIAPTIKPDKFQTNMKGYSRMSFKIKDNFETARNIEYLDYKATVDGQWILMTYDAKNDLLTHRFDDRIKAGTHQLRLVVTDSRGNEKVFEREFKR